MDRARTTRTSAAALLAAGLALALLPAGPAAAGPRDSAPDARTLDAVAAGLDAAAWAAGTDVTGWYPDPTTGRVVIGVAGGDPGAAGPLIAASGVDAGAVRVETGEPRPLAPDVPASAADPAPGRGTAAADAQIIGGEPFATDGVVRCVIGLAVDTGFVAGPGCGEVGDTASGTGGGTGTFAAVSPAGAALVVADPGWTPTPYVRMGAGLATVSGSQEAPVGAQVCRAGATTGVHCGVVQARNQTVNFPQGPVSGLTRTSICTEPGDRPGPYLSGGQAQGIHAGGAGSCATGGATYFAPINPLLAGWGVTLMAG
ncbi:S1 family peptidase [Nocardiopsis mangrovi]|uniref:S1 family peptidase n=1 Tax=Nocardiopsis mangrovi TaxID=1179818 RepID=A0ABV9E1A8_9ACTN